MLNRLLSLLLIVGALSAVDIDLSNPISYGGSQDAGYAVSYDEGTLLSVNGNAWKAVALPSPYTLTAETQLTFSVSVESNGEIIGIGLDDQISRIDPSVVFQIDGSQTWGIQDYRGQSGLVTIPIGQFLTGTFTHLVFAGDDDAQANQHTFWSNISLAERTPALPVLRLKTDETPLLQEYDAGGLTITERTIISRIQSITATALDAAAGYQLDVSVAGSINSAIAGLQTQIDRGRPGFSWTPISTVGRDALQALSAALTAASDAGLVDYDGAAAAGTLQSALRTMNALYAPAGNG